MSTDYFHDYRSSSPSRDFPSPVRAPYESPLPRSRKSSRHGYSADQSPETSSSPSPLPSTSSDKPRQGEATIFGMDPKRFTPTLHASLVSEILTLRRELDSKYRFINDLESSLGTVKAENDNLSDQVSKHTKESRLAEQRFKTLESSSLDAVEDLVRERDDAQSVSAELKSRLELLGKRARKQEEHAEQSQKIWEREKESWENERRQLERRVHVTESRLRAFVEGMSVHQATIEQQEQSSDSGPEDSTFKDSGFGNESESGSVASHHYLKQHTRNQSSVSFRSIPLSDDGARKPDVTSGNLADELCFDEADESDQDESDHEDDDLLVDGRISRSASVRDSKAKKILGFSDASRSRLHDTPSPRDSANTVTAVASFEHDLKVNSGLQRTGSIPELTAQLGLQLAGACLKFVDHGPQSTRLPTPAAISKRRSGTELSNSRSGLEIEQWELGAVGPECATNTGAHDVDLVRAASLAIRQQRNVPLSPPETPVVPRNPGHNEIRKSPTRASRHCYASSSTQTEVAPLQPEMDSLSPRYKTSTDTLPIPSISIHPPLSVPDLRGPPVLPPGMADASAQTESTTSTRSCDASVQTEEIRIDSRPVKLPSHLLPSSWDTPPPHNSGERSHPEMSDVTTRPLHLMLRPNSRKGPLKAISLPRPILLAAPQDEEAVHETPPVLVEVGSLSTPLTDISALLDPATNRSKSLRPTEELADQLEATDVHDVFSESARQFPRSNFSGPPKTVPEDRAISPAQFPLPSSFALSSRRDSDSSSIATRPRSSRGQGSISRSSCNRAAFHSRSPSETSVDSSSYGTSSHGGSIQPPPFPIPHRSSSRTGIRGGPFSETGSSPASRYAQTLGTRRSSRDLYLKHSIRKSHSYGSMNSAARISPRRRRRGPQLTPIQSMAFESSSVYDMPEVHTSPIVETPFPPASENIIEGMGDNQQPGECAVEDGMQDNLLVDAIAATMVGEWMWKYVRRRKSFGVSESTPGDDGMNGVRHKRWVWLSPYERTVMWSTKQPSSGSALLGKNGRKLIIKSVLDVKDDTPLRKVPNSEPVFNRSILIVASERALKFTAPNKERHYLWMTALSFLAQSGQGPPQIVRSPPPEPIKDPARKQRRPSFPMRYGARRDPTRKQHEKEHAFSPTLPVNAFYDQTLPHREPPTSDEAQPPHLARESSRSHQEPPTPDSAQPPCIPRLPARSHLRRRSNTNPILSPTTFSTGLRSFSSNTLSTTTTSAFSHTPINKASDDRNVNASSLSDGVPTSVATAEQPNFFEAMGTVRMEAFVDRNYHNGVLYLPASPLIDAKQNARRRGDSMLSSTTEDRRGTGHILDESGRDPFTGF